MTTYTVTGGNVLKGEVTLHGAKNVGFKAMIAALLAESSSIISNLGLISEISFASQIISSLGGKVISQDDIHSLQIDPMTLTSFQIPSEMSSKSRFAMMYAGPLLAKFGQVAFPEPGGDKFANRPIDRHLDGLKAMGVEINFKDGMFYGKAPNGLKGANYRFRKNSHNGTEVLILTAVKASGETILDNAAAEPEIDDLIKFLQSMGAKIDRIAPRTIKIIGVDHLQGAKHKVMADRNEAVTYACAALATKGNVKVKEADPQVLGAFLEKINQSQGNYQISPDGIRFSWISPLSATQIITVPYPGFMTDWQPLWATVMTQAEGESIIHEAVFENRFDYVPSLIKMGADISLFNPPVANPDDFYNFNLEDDQGHFHAAKIIGPCELTGSEVEVNDVRSGATSLLAGLIAHGRTTIYDPKDQIKRGYEGLTENLINLGAKITTESQ